MVASGALAGIMTFGGLLRPLTEHGLNGGQVLRIISDLMPAMTSYSLPIAALFATTVVYGRLAADNELLACRASGIGHLSVTLPGLLLGLMIAIASLVLNCFYVPKMTLDVERTIYSNLATIIASQIERTHQTKLRDMTVFAQSAQVPPVDPARPDDQVVVLSGPMIVRYSKADPKHNIPRLPREFFMARKATLHIRPNRADDEEVLMEAVLEGGTKFPRDFESGMQVGIEATQFGPFPLPSGIRERAKFMDIYRLKELDADPTRSIKVKSILGDFVRDAQVSAAMEQIIAELDASGASAKFQTGEATNTIRRGKKSPVVEGATLRLISDPELEDHPIVLQQHRGERAALSVQAREARLHLSADSERARIIVAIDLFDCLIDTGSGPIPRASFPVRFSFPMNARMLAMQNRTIEDFLADKSSSQKQRATLLEALVRLSNRVRSEMHARASFSVSCLILVMMGAAMGMIFKSGNFLNAFAISVIPAILTIVLVVSGQNMSEGIPNSLYLLPNPVTNPLNPLYAGLFVMWSGNVIVLVIAVALLWRLHRQ